ncbi:hypothetical protein [Blastopirellula marina]|uniref:Uncharacterized protein n=1 Tax=Blastopirellula marina TaxID=124 RepID=A0A2S8GT63_9BACT|nr:hypothetical protein [Blastopirellula marina]PQO47617.1 hypothetical protein C5Y93_02875 [Blastopirellula marina]
MTIDPQHEIASLIAARDQFFQSVEESYSFTSFISCSLTTAAEAYFRQAMMRCELPNATILTTLGEDLKQTHAYDLATCGARTAITAVRVADDQLYRIALWPLLAGLSAIDWRDALRYLAVVEDCGARLGRSAQKDLAPLWEEKKEEKTAKICESYFARSDAMRNLSAMGLHSFGTNEELWYQG